MTRWNRRRRSLEATGGEGNDAAGRPGETAPADGWFAVSRLSVRYGQALAVRDVSIDVRKGEVVGIIGPNGAGKTSLLRAISGLVRPASGEIWFTGHRIDGLAPEAVVKLGIAHVPEGRRLFGSMTTRENLKLGAYVRDRKPARADLATVVEHFPILGRRGRQRAGSLSGGEQQMLALGRALMAKPRLLLLDEPTMGLAPMVVKEITEIIRNISEQYGVGIVLVEQNARLALSIAPRAYVVELGRVAVEGPSSELVQDERIRTAYLAR
jgi:branched-chain amino acid transport system ATP-binding protein